MTKNWTHIIRLTVSLLVFIFLIFVNRYWTAFYWIPSSTNDQSQLMTILLLVVGGVFVLYQFIVFAFYIITRNNTSLLGIVMFLEKGLFTTLHTLYHDRFSVRQRMNIALFGWGTFIFLFICSLSWIRLFDKQETFFLEVNYFQHLHRRTILEKYNGKDGFKKYLKEEPVRYFNFISEDNNTDKYLRDLYKIVKDLKDAGAKVVVADLPTGLNMFKTKLFDKIDSLRITVWADRSPSWALKYFSHKDFIRFERVNSKIIYSAENDNMKPSYIMHNQKIVRWYPFMCIENVSHTQFQTDIALWVAKKYFNMPDSADPLIDGNEVIIHDLRIPVSSYGEALTDNVSNIFHRFPISASRGLGGLEGYYEYNPDSLRYNAIVEISKNYSAISPKDTVKNLLHYKDYFEGKVVVINWLNNTTSDWFEKILTANVISSVLRKKFITKHESITYILSLLAIILLAIISARFKMQWLIYSSIAIFVVVFTAAVWIFFSQKIIFDALYPMFTVFIAATIFSLLKISRESVH